MGAECLNLGKREVGLFPHAVPQQSLPHVSCPIEYRDGKEIFDDLVRVVGFVRGRRVGAGGWACGSYHRGG